jgi:NAD+ kinase
MRPAMLGEKSIQVDIFLSTADQAPIEFRGAFMACVVRPISLKSPFDDLRYGSPLAARELMREITRSGAPNGKLRFRYVGIPRLAWKIGSKPPAIKPSRSGSADVHRRKAPDFEAARPSAKTAPRVRRREDATRGFVTARALGKVCMTVMTPAARTQTIAFLSSGAKEANEALERLTALYGNSPLDEADVIVALGGDGLMLQTLHMTMKAPKPIYGMNRGSVGFLMNDYSEQGLPERLRVALRSIIHPLIMRTRDINGSETTARAINEVSLLRQTYQAAKLRIEIDDIVQLEELIADGILVSTPAGSTAYNLSANGPILPLGVPLMALTPLSPFRPRRWRGALLRDSQRVTIEIMEADKRPVAAVADHFEIRRVVEVEVAMDKATSLILLHDPGHSLDERILREQFRY